MKKLSSVWRRAASAGFALLPSPLRKRPLPPPRPRTRSVDRHGHVFKNYDNSRA